MSGIPVFSAGASLQSSGASVSAQIPADSAGMLPLFVRVTATAAGYFKLSQDGASAAVGDLLIQPSDGLILKTCGLSQFSFVSQSGASTVTVTPIDVGGIKYPANIFTPAALFATGVSGAWYDPSDFSTMFQDAAGTLPVTAVGQPVGLMLDKSKGLVLGPELVTNGDFSNGATGWTAPSGWGVSAGVMNKFAGVANALTQTISSTTAKWYRVSATVVRNSGTLTVSIGTSGTASGSISASGAYTWTLLAGSGTQDLYFTADASFAGSIDNISVRELPGNHAFNPSGNSANFPVLSARYNLLTKTEDFSDAVWTKNNSTITPNAVTSPSGNLTADKLVASNVSGGHFTFTYNASAYPVGAYTYSCYAKAAEYGFFALGSKALDGSGDIFTYFNLSTGTVSSTATGHTASIQSVGNGWYRCVISATFTGTPTTWYLLGTPTSGTYIYQGDGTSGIYIWGADLRVSNDALNQPAYQRVNTATDYDTVGFKPYLSFNGVNQWLQTNNIDFTYGDKMFVSAGVRKLSDAALGMLLEQGIAAGSAVSMRAPAGASATYAFSSVGTSGATITSPTSYSAPISNVVTGIGDISGDSIVLRVNGTQVATSTADQGTGNYGNYPMYIGARAGSSLWFNGCLYGLVVAGKSASASEITNTEAWLNSKTGAY